MKTSTSHHHGPLPMLVRGALMVLGAGLGILLEKQVGQVPGLLALGIFLLGLLVIFLVATAATRVAAPRRGEPARARWRDVASRPGVDAVALVWFGAWLGVAVLGEFSLLGSLGLLVITAVVLGMPEAARGRRERSEALAAAPGSVVVLVAPVDLAVMRLGQWAQACGQAPPDLGERALLVADGESLVLRRAGGGPRRSGGEAEVCTAYRWSWHEVALEVAPRRGHRDQAVIVLGLPVPPGAGDRRFEVTLALRSEGGSTSEEAHAAVAELQGRRPARSAG